MQSIWSVFCKEFLKDLVGDKKTLTIRLAPLNMVFKYSSACKEDETCQQLLQLRFWVSLNHGGVSETCVSVGKQLFGICAGNCGLVLQD